jgi:hypothetical protein
MSMSDELKLENFNRAEWNRVNGYYYQHEETGKQVHEETYKAKCDKKIVWADAIQYATEELQPLIDKWRKHGGPADSACADELEEKISNL